MSKQTKAGATNTGSNQKLIYAGGTSKSFDVFDNSENTEKVQCDICNPPLSKGLRAVKLCDGCQAKTEQMATVLLKNFRRHRKVIKLDCYCFACDQRKTLSMMSKMLPICRKCADELKTKKATARNNFIARATNNFFKGLKRGVVQL